jgi:hypothetical protein
MPEKTRFTLPDSSEVLAELVRAIPSTWSWVDGRLDPPQTLVDSGKVARRAGFRISRFSINQIIIGLWNQEERRTEPPDLEEILITGKLPTFINFDEAGFETRNPDLDFAKRLAAHHLLLGYRGWLDFSAGCYYNSKHQNPASLRLNFLRENPHQDTVNWQGEAEWNERYGGKAERLEPILAACRRLGLVQAIGN